ncbi:hypothetical protein [Alkalihalobacillus sp. CinArs1]|uniref:hypothetical protein n=1 Tax=Alkalihalobacillus sp. CinArs1 TaxID=2995314 RepID=UPI0022DE2BFF|nr:hypothetical protein [Alkalihalobacillus sp. CinArs1]
MREYPLETMVEMVLEHFEINTIENEHFRMNTLRYMIEEGLLEDLPHLAKEIKRQRAEILIEPMRSIDPEAAKQVELWLQFV